MTKHRFVVSAFVLLIFGVIVFSWWLTTIDLGNIGVGILSGCLLVVTYNYLRIVA